MKLSLTAITVLSPLALSQARIITSTIFYGNCWTDVDGGTITTSLPGATSTYSDPATTTQTFVYWDYSGLVGRAGNHGEGLTIVETDQCTETDTAYVTSTVRETVATLTSTVTQYASTATVTVTSICEGWDC